MKVELDKEQIEIIRNGLESELDDEKSAIETWRQDQNGTLQKVYEKRRHQQILMDMKNYVRRVERLDNFFWKKLKKFKGKSSKEKS